jgi:hypothetical protein
MEAEQFSKTVDVGRIVWVPSDTDFLSGDERTALQATGDILGYGCRDRNLLTGSNPSRDGVGTTGEIKGCIE